MRRIGQNALAELFKRLSMDKMGGHQVERVGHRPRAGLRHQALRVRRPVQPAHRAHRAQRRRPPGPRHPGAAAARRLRGRAHRAPDPVEHGADARPLAVDADARQLPARQEGGDGAALAHLQPLPAGLPRHRRLQRGGPGAQARPAPRGLLGLRLRHQHAARVPAEPPDAGPPVRHQADHHDHRRRADRPHPAQRRGVLQLPAGAGDRRGHPARGGQAARRRTSASTPSCSTPTGT